MKLNRIQKRIANEVEAIEIAVKFSETNIDFEPNKPFFIINDAPLGIRISQHKTRRSAERAVEKLHADGYKNIFMVER